MQATVYTDVGCSGNPGPGGWAYVIVDGSSKQSCSGRVDNTTNNRMELTAVIRALEDIASNEVLRAESIELHTDSQYVQKGMTSWITGWERNGWVTSAKKPVKNQDLWKQLSGLNARLHISWRWVRGHVGDELNEECDALVRKEIYG